MKGLQLAVVLVCVNLVSLWALPAGEDGQWIDDVSNNPEVMGFDKETRSQDEAVAVPDSISSNVQVEDDGEWVDDVTGNQIIMGEDPLSQDSGLSGKTVVEF